MIAALLLAGSIASAPADAGQLAFAEKALVRGEVLTLGQVADIQMLPAELRAQAFVLPLLGRREAKIIEHSKLASRARSLMPALVPWLRGPFEGQLVVSARGTQSLMPMASCDGSDGGVTRGEALVVRVSTGPFLIQREGVAMQDAHPGERLFVRTAEGSALVVQCEGAD